MLIYYLFIIDFHSSTSATNIDQIHQIHQNYAKETMMTLDNIPKTLNLKNKFTI